MSNIVYDCFCDNDYKCNPIRSPMLDNLNNLYLRCKKLLSINNDIAVLKNKIKMVEKENNAYKNTVASQINKYEQQLKKINCMIDEIAPKTELIHKINRKKENVYCIEKESVVGAENDQINNVSQKLRILEDYDDINLLEDADYFYFVTKNKYTENNQLEIVNTEKIPESNSLLCIKSNFSRAYYKVFLKKMQKNIFTENFEEKVISLNQRFINTVFYYNDINELKCKILISEAFDISERSKQTEIMAENSTISIDIKLFLGILTKLDNIVVNDRTKLIKYMKLAISTFFDNKRSKTMFEKLLGFSDALYFSKNYEKPFYDKNKIKNAALENIINSITFDFNSTGLASHLQNSFSAYNEAVDDIFRDHWNNTLKRMFKDKFYNIFISYVLGHEKITEYDAFHMTKISELLFNQGINKLENFGHLFISKKMPNLLIESDDVNEITKKITFK